MIRNQNAVAETKNIQSRTPEETILVAHQHHRDDLHYCDFTTDPICLSGG
jgi:hypothetical protein